MQGYEAECSLDEVRGMEVKTYFWEKQFSMPLLADWTYHRVMPARVKYRWYGILTVCFFACAAISVYAAEMELAAVTGNTVYFMDMILVYPMAFCIQILLLLRFG